MNRLSIALVSAGLLATCIVLDAAEPQAAPTKQVAPTAIDQLLAEKGTVEFKLLSLELAAQEIQKRFTAERRENMPRITVVGKDLQLDGITRNQQVREFSQRDKSLADTLTALVVQANPVRNTKSTADPNQRLIWVVAPDGKSILITTREAAKARGYKLPAAFRGSEK